MLATHQSTFQAMAPRLLAALILIAASAYFAVPAAISLFLVSANVQDEASNPRQAIFDELSPAETRAVAKYVVDAMTTKDIEMKTTYFPEIPLSALASAAFGDMAPLYDSMLPHGHNYIAGTTAVTLFPPAKDAALAYVDGISDERPDRYAKVVVTRGTALDVMEYKVGPIRGCDTNACDAAVVEKGSPIVPLTTPGSISYEKRPFDIAETGYATIFDRVFEPLKPLLLETFGKCFSDLTYPGCGSECFSGKEGTVFPIPLNDISSTSKQRVYRVVAQWLRDWDSTEAMYLHVLPFSFKVATIGTDPKDWKVYHLTYCGHGPYESAEALLQANPPRCTFKPIEMGASGRRGDWDIPGAPDSADYELRQAMPPPPPPRSPPQYSLAGVKGGNGRLVEWQGWSFFATHRPSTGLAAMDIKFKGTRIAYELALIEAAAHYSGSGGDQSLYLDSAASMSQLGSDLKRGLDCPKHASYLQGTIWEGPTTLLGTPYVKADLSEARHYDAFCVFEEYGSTSHWRHYDVLSSRTGGIPSSSLVVRAVTAVGNYDYITEFRFSLDGSIRVAFQFAGYMETRWFAEGVNSWERDLGEVVHQNVAAPLHSHFGCFKVDLDGKRGLGESLEQTTVGAAIRTNLPEHVYATKYLERAYPATETTYKPGAETANRQFAIVDNDAATSGAPRGDATPSAKPGYIVRVGPTTGQVLPDDHPFVLSSAFSKYMLAVTRRKESEGRVTSVYDWFGASEPVVSIDNFLDGEGIAQEDLVAWVTIGKEHLPRTEDLPLISNFGSFFDLVPSNMHSVNAAMDVKAEL